MGTVTNVWLISDTHFGHQNILNFTMSDGKPFRKFDTVIEMNECMETLWNETVDENDTVYHLGDVFFGNADVADATLGRLKGRKFLVLGNHDDYWKFRILEKHFNRISMWELFHDYLMMLTHMPVHVSQLEPRFAENPDDVGLEKVKVLNVHGHIHANPSPSGPYKNVSVEAINYTPINIDAVR